MKLTREQLAKFLPDPRTIKQFENLLDLVSGLEPDTLDLLTLIAGGADPKANEALAQLSRIADALERIPPAQQDNAAVTDYVDFGSGSFSGKQRRLGWNANDGTLDLGMGYDGVTQQVGLETYYRIKASANITNGQLVMFSGSVGASGVLSGQPSTGLTSGQFVMGIATMDIPINEFGYVTYFGLVRGIDTTGTSVGETWNDGDRLYYNSAYPGGLTKFRPVSPIPYVICAAVVKAGSGSSGSLFVRTTFLPRISELSDIHFDALADKDSLVYIGAESRWENRKPSDMRKNLGFGDGTPENGQIPIGNGANYITTTLTAGSNVAITNGAGSVSIATTGASGVFTAGANTVTVSNGVITSIV